MYLDPAKATAPELYQYLTWVIAPRPIAWITTCSRAGVINLAPYSFFTGVGSRPPSLLFCPANRRDGTPKDSLRNILETQEFVVNVVPFSLAGEMNLTSLELPPEESELPLTGLEVCLSRVVQPPGLAMSPVRMECRLMQHLSIQPGPGGANVVIGELIHLYVADEMLDAQGRIRPDALALIGRLGGASYCKTDAQFVLPRPKLPPSSTG